MKYLMFLLLFLVTACHTQSYLDSAIPLRSTFEEISDRPYELDKYDCSNKSVDYYWELLKAGYKAKIVLVPRHAFVWVKYWGYYDPTSKQFFSIKGSTDPWKDWSKDWRLSYTYGYLENVIDDSEFHLYNDEFKKVK